MNSDLRKNAGSTNESSKRYEEDKALRGELAMLDVSFAKEFPEIHQLAKTEEAAGKKFDLIVANLAQNFPSEGEHRKHELEMKIKDWISNLIPGIKMSKRAVAFLANCLRPSGESYEPTEISEIKDAWKFYQAEKNLEAVAGDEFTRAHRDLVLAGLDLQRTLAEMKTEDRMRVLEVKAKKAILSDKINKLF